MEYLYEAPYITGKPKLAVNPILRTAHIMGWLFGHPSAWKSYIAEIAPDLESNFCLLELKSHHWRNPAIRQILISAYLVLPLMMVAISLLWMIPTRQPTADIIRAVILCFNYVIVSSTLIGLVSSVALGLGFSMVLGLFISIPDSMGGILYAIILAAGLGGQVAMSTSSDRPARSKQAQIVGVSMGVLSILVMIITGYVIVNGTLTGADETAQLGQGITFSSALAFGIGSGVVGGIVYFTVARLRVNNALTPILVAIFILISCTVGYAGSLSIPHTNLLIHFFGSTTGAILFSGLFLLPYALVARVAGTWAGVISGALSCGMSWLPVYDYLIFESSGRNPLMEMPYGHVWIAIYILAGLTFHYWMPVLTYPGQVIWNQLLYQRDLQVLPNARPAVKWNSVFWDEFQLLPLRRLDKHLVLIYKNDPKLGQHLMHLVNASHQHWAVQEAQIELDAYQLESFRSVEAIAKAHEALSLSRTIDSPTNVILNMFSLISQDTQVALNHTSSFHIRLGMKAIEDRLNGMLRDLTRSNEPKAQRFYRVAGEWLRVVQAYIIELERKVEDSQEIDNPYIVGVPITEQQRIFVGRSDIAVRLEQWLSNQRCPPLFLYGQRRMGKTSLLLNLRKLIRGDILPLFIDGQYIASGENYREIIKNTAREFNRSATRQRNLSLPELEQADLEVETMVTFNEWLDQIEEALDQQGFKSALLALDEFDALYTAAERGCFDEVDFLNLLRYLIQHRTRFRVLLTSARSPNEFGDWTSQLINLQVIHLGPLKPEEARQLVEHPTQDFPLKYTPEACQRVIQLSGGHPFLLQLLCYEIVLLKNSQPLSERHTANLEDVEASVVPALSSGQFFFEGIQRQGISEVGLAILKQIAFAGEGALMPVSSLGVENPEVVRSQLKLILLRELLAEAEPGMYRYNVEIIRRWFTR